MNATQSYGTKTKCNKKLQRNLGRATSPFLTAENDCATKSPLVTVRCPTFAPKTAPSLPIDDLHLHLIHPSLDQLHPPPRTASRSNQPFFHNSPTGPTDRPRQTDGIGAKSAPTPRISSIDCIATRLKITVRFVKGRK